MRLPRRYSLKLFLAVVTAACCMLTLRLWPAQTARGFARIVEAEGLRAALHKVDQQTKQELNEYAESRNYPDVQLTAVDGSWRVLKSGSCRTTFKVRWSTTFAGGEDTLVVEFHPGGEATHTVHQTSGFTNFTTI